MKCGTFFGCMSQPVLIQFSLCLYIPLSYRFFVHHYKELLECIREIEKLEAISTSTAKFSANQKDVKCLMIKEEEEAQKMEQTMLLPPILDDFFFNEEKVKV